MVTQTRSLEQAFFVKNGFVLIRNLFTTQQAAQMADQAAASAGLSPGDYATEADAVNRFPVALDAVTSPEITSSIRSIMGDQVKFLQLADLHQNHNSWNWHRDSVHRDFGIGKDWDEQHDRYDISKLILYLHADSFGLAVVSGSHQQDVPPPKNDFHTAVSLTDDHIRDTTVFPPGQLILISPKAGDAILFDERLLHCGRPHNDAGFTSELKARKMTLCWVFGNEGQHARRFHSYFRFVRANYEPLVNGTRAALEAASLLPAWIDKNHFHEAPEELEGIFFPEDSARTTPRVREYGIRSANELRKVYENNRRLADLQDAYRHQTVYVVGSGPSLKSFESEWLAEVEKCPAIGLNRSTYLVRTPFFLSAYITENLMAKMQSPKTECLHVRPSVTVPVVDGILTAKRIFSEDPKAIGRQWSIEEPALYTRNNAMFAATHWGLIMGASNICYVGIEQRNGLHFYNTETHYQEQMFRDLSKVIADHGNLMGRDHPYETPFEMMRRLFESPRELAKRKFYDIDHAMLLRQWFDFMDQSLDAGAISCTVDSVVCDTGAPYLPLSHCIEEGWKRDPQRKHLARGFVDTISIVDNHIRLAGWAVDLEGRRGCAEVLLMAGDKLICRTPVAFAREDVAIQLSSRNFLNCGFDTTQPIDSRIGPFQHSALRAYGKTAEGTLFRLSDPTAA